MIQQIYILLCKFWCHATSSIPNPPKGGVGYPKSGNVVTGQTKDCAYFRQEMVIANVLDDIELAKKSLVIIEL